jgi:hypothetical protein
VKSILIIAVFLLAGLNTGYAQNQTFGDTPSFQADQSITWPGDIASDEGPSELPIKGFGQINFDYEYISPSEFTDSPLRGQELGFGEGTLAVSYTRLFSLEHGLNFGIGHTKTTLWWTPDPVFNETDFDVLNFSFNGFTKLWKCLEIKGGVSASVDTHHWRLDYTYYNITGWGRYIWKTGMCGDVGLNFGATARTGLKGEFVYPILGIDFSPREDLQFNLIFPVDMVITQKISEHISLRVAGKLWNSRRRLGENEVIPNGFFEYRNAGIQLGAVLDFEPYASANVHIGSTLGTGDVRLSDTNDVQEAFSSISPAPYVGGEVWFRF